MSDLGQLLGDVAKWRRQVDMEKNGVVILQERLAETEPWVILQEAKASLALAQGALGTCEMRARDEVLAEYGRTQNKAPIKGAGVRVLRKATYVLADALAWCRANAPALLTVDEKAFAKADLPGAPITWEENATATLATDLSEYLV